MARTTLFELDRVPVPDQRRRRRGKVVDDGRPLDLRYAWSAYREPQVADATGTGKWTAALEDDIGGDPTTTEPVEARDETPRVPAARTTESSDPTVRTRPVADTRPATADPGSAAPAAPRASVTVGSPTDGAPTATTGSAAIPAVGESPLSAAPPAPSGPSTATTTEHDDRFMRAIADAARGVAREPEPTADDAAPPTPAPVSASMSHSIFDRLGSRLAQATSYDAGSFSARQVFDRLDRELDAGAPPGGDPPPARSDVVEDLAAILGTPTEDLRTRLGRDTEAPESDRRGTRAPFSVATTRTPIEKLQAYLGVTETDFAASEAQYFAGLKEHLVRVGTVTRTDTVDRSTFADAVAEFQRSRGLTHDGIPGEDTLWELQHDWAVGRNLDIREVPADVWMRPPLTEAQYVPDDHGYRTFRLRQDAADLYDAMRTDAQAAGVLITSSGSLRSLSATVTAGRSDKSMHYSGIALDLATVTGMRDPAVDPYLLTADGDRWRIWARTESGEERTLDAVVWSAGATRTQTVEAKVIDLTALAERHGFGRIPHRSSFPASYLSAEWWHLQANQLLVPWVSQFGIELLSLARYSESDLRAATGIWNNRKAIFKRRPAANGWH